MSPVASCFECGSVVVPKVLSVVFCGRRPGRDALAGRPGEPPTVLTALHGHDDRVVTASFTADSPYFSSYVDREMHSLNVLHDTVKDISARAQTFGRCGGLMAEATRRLSQACHLQPSGGTSSGPRSPSDDRGADADPEARDRELALREQRRNAVGSEMESVLSVLGGVSSASERSGFWAC